MIDFTINRAGLEHNIQKARENNIIIPTIRQMREPDAIPGAIKDRLKNVGLWDINPLNLFRISWKNEAKESGEVYPAFAAAARDEGFGEIARKLELIARVENCHAGRFEAFRRLLAEHKLFVSDLECGWICLNCGHELRAKAAPQSCPVCGEAGYFIRVEMSPYSYQ